MTSMQDQPRRRRVAVGVDTHKHIHVAVALDDLGGWIDSRSFAADSSGYEQLIDWAQSLGQRITFGVEGTGSYGAGLASAIRRRNVGVLEVLRTDRRDRRLRGKSDTLDAENAARAVLNGQARAVPKNADGTVEMIRLVKVAKDVAVKARTSAMISLKSVLVNAPAELREQLQPLTKMVLIRRCAALRPGPIDDVSSAAKHTLRAIAKRWLALDAEIKTHEQILTQLTTALAPELVAAFGIGADVAAEMLIVVGDNVERVRSEAAFARLCGVAPVPASSGMTTRHRLNRGGHRQANAALYRAVVVRIQYHQPTQAYLARRTAEGKTKKEIIRCLKRLLAREVWAHFRPLRQAREHLELAA
ncbi:MAG: IS110 family transposase [Propionibacteriaceae bacterium]|nr:MAG: IS110 family transposase [Propionibacteriaceae bacterium]